MWHNALQTKLRSGQTAFGPFLRMPGPINVELAGAAGFDFVVIDQEHAALDLRDTEGMILAALAAGVTPLVRLLQGTAPLIHRTLDLGARGVIVPQVDSAAEARLAANAFRYAPAGRRGLAGPTRGDAWGHLPLSESMPRLNDEVLGAVQIESAAALAELDEIAATPGIDMLFVGPMDLSQSLGLPGQVDHEDVRGAIQRVIAACRREGKLAGIFAGNGAAARYWQAQGVALIATGLDTVLLGQALRALRQEVGQG